MHVYYYVGVWEILIIITAFKRLQVFIKLCVKVRLSGPHILFQIWASELMNSTFFIFIFIIDIFVSQN